MFATLAGGYPAEGLSEPAGASSGAALERAIRDILAEQAAAGLTLLTDGGIRWPDPVAGVGGALLDAETASPGSGEVLRRARPARAGRGSGGATPRVRWPGPLTVAEWAFAASAAGDLPVKQCLPGPYTLGRRLGDAGLTSARAGLTVELADALADELVALAEAGCPFIQIDEDDAVRIGTDAAERALFREAQAHLLARLGAPRPHLSLAISGGNADTAGPDTIFAAPYDSHFFDLLAGPDNWRLVTRAPGERGVVLGVVDALSTAADVREAIVWAVGYAASSQGRGEARIGIAPSGSMAGLPRAVARQKIELLGEVVGLVADRHATAIASALDPRAVDKRAAGLGRWSSRRGRLG